MLTFANAPSEATISIEITSLDIKLVAFSASDTVEDV